jgi:hypothetical protein
MVCAVVFPKPVQHSSAAMALHILKTSKKAHASKKAKMAPRQKRKVKEGKTKRFQVSKHGVHPYLLQTSFGSICLVSRFRKGATE